VTLPDGTQRVTFVDGRQGPNTTVPTRPPVIWQLDPESLQAGAIWTVTRGTPYEKGERTGMVYDFPESILWSPESAHEFPYYAGGAVWRVDLESQKDERLGAAARSLLTWTAEGIVSQEGNVLRLLDEASGTEQTLPLGAVTPQPQAPTVYDDRVDWDVPFIHQLWDTKDSFDGHWACGPTSAVMALAYFNRLAPHRITTSYCPPQHASYYGWYVADEQGYTFQSACSDTAIPPEGYTHTFDEAQRDPDGYLFASAYGACMQGGYASADLIWKYVGNHDVGYHYYTPDDSITQYQLQEELRQGAVVLLRTGSRHTGTLFWCVDTHRMGAIR